MHLIQLIIFYLLAVDILAGLLFVAYLGIFRVLRYILELNVNQRLVFVNL